MPTLKTSSSEHSDNNMLMSSSSTPSAANAATGNDNDNASPQRQQQQPLSLERKLELLESRFTSPPSQSHASNGAMVVDGGDPNDGHHHHDAGRSHLSLSSPSGSQLSHHSFTFDPHSNSGGSEHSTASNLPSSSVRSKRKSSSSVLAALSLAADRQMKKVMINNNKGNSNLQQHQFHNHFHQTSSQSSTSNQTLLTSHRSSQTQSQSNHSLLATPHHQQQQQQPQVVAESPPPKMVTPKIHTTTTTTTTTNPVTTSTRTATKQEKRKKSVPVKRNQPSLTSTPSTPKSTTSPLLSPKQSKNTSTATTTPPRSAHKRARIASNASDHQPINTRVTLSPVRSHHQHHDGGHHSRSNTSTTTSSKQGKTSTTETSSKKTCIPPRNNKLIRDFFTSAVKQNNSSTHNNSKSTTTLQPPGQPQAPFTTTTTSYNRPRIMSLASPDATTSTSSSQQGGMMKPQHTKVLVSSKPPPTTPPPVKMEKLQHKIHDLQSSLQEKDEQLKAVANNQTILHTALKSALVQKEQEYTELESKMDLQLGQHQKVMETLKREEAQREGRDLRDVLAADGARLGRLVYTRAGLSLHSVESWQDGHAPRALKRKRTLLEQKKQKLHERYQQAKTVVGTFRRQTQQNENTDPNANETPHDDDDDTSHKKEGMVVGGIMVQDALAAMEAEESVRLHLSNVQREEQDLIEEEHALFMEKSQHIRNLKRVASEDGSRFKSRPKLHGRYVLQSLLGKGGFSEVWRAYDLIELREVAVKIHQLDPRWSDAKKENYTKHVSREYEIHRDVRHPRIVSLFDVFEIDNNSFATVLELCKGTDLDALLKEKKRLPERDARAILIQILTGMQYLSLPSSEGNRQGIIHYDLKPGNILFDENGDAKITDFGLSKIVDAPDPADSMELTSQGAGTYWYLPPECFVTHQSVRISNKVDVWSIGVIYYQMLFGKRPFGDGQSQDKVLSNHTMLNAREVKFPDKVPISQEGQEFIKQCLMYDQAFRPTVGQLCQSSYLLEKIKL